MSIDSTTKPKGGETPPPQRHSGDASTVQNAGITANKASVPAPGSITPGSSGPVSAPSPASPPAPAHPNATRGKTIVKSKAIERVAGQVAADTLGVSFDNVKVSIRDDGSRLGLDLEAPLSEADLMRCSLRPDMTVFSLCDSARETIVKRAAHITGYTIGDINVVINGVEKEPANDRRVE